MFGGPDHPTIRPKGEANVTADPLSDVLRSVRLNGGVFLDARFTAPWCVSSQVIAADCKPILRNPSQMISYHYMTEGQMQISVADGVPMTIKAGELVLLPRNDPHVIGSAQNLPVLSGRDLVRPSPDGGLARVVHGGGGDPARMICGFLGSDQGFNPLIATLPAILKIDVRAGAARGLIEASLDYAAREMADGRVASPAALAQLSELLFVEAVRHYASTLTEETSGWLKGMSDPQIGRALSLIHADIKINWTAEALAKAVAMSRSAFMSRFAALVGVPPIRYLTQFRLGTAKTLLSETAKTVSQVAFDIGYDSEDAFSRAFKREFGTSPANWRD
jgi:AraC-like DNA-binding protein